MTLEAKSVPLLMTFHAVTLFLIIHRKIACIVLSLSVPLSPSLYDLLVSFKSAVLRVHLNTVNHIKST